jgi:hypothetical protein
MNKENEDALYEITFPKKMYINCCKYLNVICYDITEPNFYIQEKKRYIILKQPWTF